MSIKHLSELIPQRIKHTRYLSKVFKDQSLYRQIRGNLVELKEFGIIIDVEKHSFFLKRINVARNLKEDCGAFFFQDEFGDLFVRVNNITFHVSSDDDIYILGEVFWNNIYDINLPGVDDLVVCDIGMNVGIASLFFASKSNISRVYSYEPIEDTYRMALRNISLNPELGLKVQSKNQGLGSETHRIYIKFDPMSPGKTSPLNFTTEPSDSYKRADIVDAGAEIKRIIAENPSAKIVLKVDCEGCEFKVLKSLNESGALAYISLCIVEWHGLSPQELIDGFYSNGYVVISMKISKNAGLLYSYNPMPNIR